MKIKLGGFMGEVEYRGDISDFVALLKLGAKVHVGKATGFGLGKYELQGEE
ncbi:MAG: CRISPR system precrRNA processing endoribonuclease RAMP protein Cas6 [Deltaproteobacteria bacterium]|nr:CRISPR system precrRNA processing endoribonuclease RAMP protein Cas6 [Deltaproteobacteria bacterium]MDZ4346040.1 CRISPR system precrRNA processing endoribonuclease RAMP protein Cas6 [Candidatus Binatia bacterium]